MGDSMIFYSRGNQKIQNTLIQKRACVKQQSYLLTPKTRVFLKKKRIVDFEVSEEQLPKKCNAANCEQDIPVDSSKQTKDQKQKTALCSTTCFNEQVDPPIEQQSCEHNETRLQQQIIAQEQQT